MMEYRKNYDFYKLAKQFVAGGLEATEFVDKYIDIWYDKSYGNPKDDCVEIDENDYVKDTALLSSIFLHCDTHESMNVNNPYTDEELKEVVKIFLVADSVDDGYKEIAEKGLLK
ncbi:colicin immunity domain-containing protein [Pasteurella skyensis]|uniref:colicin immunity domain-containing protein n=1 Tax=Phocoenobacter skyensis TaxID=97481 RepID=UPI0027945C9B|nr:colicin immunity domain-containing protein [Pasteurella skyensis]MDP8170269.1 colicin immunity domain-containing protein [Pasteurella skyensis]